MGTGGITLLHGFFLLQTTDAQFTNETNLNEYPSPSVLFICLVTTLTNTLLPNVPAPIHSIEH